MIRKRYILKQFIFQVFRKLARIFSGSGLRDRYEIINSIYQLLNRGLSPGTARVHGHIMYLDNDDSMGLSINEVYEPHETQLLIDFIKPGNVILDVGDGENNIVGISFDEILAKYPVGYSGHTNILCRRNI
jgi:hypothetical protein